MELTTLKANIRTKSFEKFYIFTGPEWKIMNIYIEQMAKVTGYEIKKFDSIQNLGKKLHSSSFLSVAEICVFTDCKDILLNEDIHKQIDTIESKIKHIFIFVFNDIDKRTKFYKKYQDKIIVFEPMKTETLIKYVEKEIPLREGNAKRLIEICENDYGRILLEIDKIKRYAKAFNSDDYDKLFNQLLEDNAIYQPPKDAVFAFVDAVLKNKKKLAYKLLEETYDSGEATLVILTNLYNGAKQVLQVQTYGGDNLASASGLTSFQIKLARERLGYYREDDLIRLMKFTRQAEVGVKTGAIEEPWAVLNVLARFWNE